MNLNISHINYGLIKEANFTIGLQNCFNDDDVSMMMMMFNDDDVLNS